MDRKLAGVSYIGILVLAVVAMQRRPQSVWREWMMDNGDAGCVWGAPWRSRYYVYAIDYDRGGEWMGQAVTCTRDMEFTIHGIGDCLARGYDRTGFFEVDTGGQRAWTVQLTESSEQPPGGPGSGAPSGGSGALPLLGGTPAIALPPGRAASAPSLPPSGARTQ